jgi:RNA polymerase sigma-70 factor (ECF subfamily)
MGESLESEGSTVPLEFADWSPTPEERYRADELREILKGTLQKLRPGLRVVFVLRDIEGISTDQTAEVLALTPAAVKTRLWAARLFLREQLSRYFGTAGPDTRNMNSSDRRESRWAALKPGPSEPKGPET